MLLVMAINRRYGGCSFFEAKAKAEANAQGNGNPSVASRGLSLNALQGNDIGANAIRFGPEGNCNRKGAVATSVRSEARSKQRMLCFEEANVA